MLLRKIRVRDLIDEQVPAPLGTVWLFLAVRNASVRSSL